MPYDVILKGKEIEIHHSVNGAYSAINDVLKNIETKKRQLVIDSVKLLHANGEGIDITSLDGDELTSAFHDFENLGLKIAEDKMTDSVEAGDFSNWSTEELDKFGEKIIVTTETCFTDMEIDQRIEVITAEVIFGMNFFKDLLAQITDLVGGRSGQIQKVMRDARKICVKELKREAVKLGANAIIGVRLDYNDIGSNNYHMVMLAGSGTAVKLKT